MAEFAAEPMIAPHHMAVTHHGAADADIGGQVDEGVSRFDQSDSPALRGITGNLRQCGRIRLVVDFRIESTHHVEGLQVKLLPTKVARSQQTKVIGDQARQCEPRADQRIPHTVK